MLKDGRRFIAEYEESCRLDAIANPDPESASLKPLMRSQSDVFLPLRNGSVTEGSASNQWVDENVTTATSTAVETL
jgi:hypothetical protein